MHGSAKLFILLVIGLALGFLFDVFAPNVGVVPNRAGAHEVRPALEFGSYTTGLVVGMFLLALANVRWHQLPVRIQRAILSKVHVYQFVAVGGLCLAVLYYY